MLIITAYQDVHPIPMGKESDQNIGIIKFHINPECLYCADDLIDWRHYKAKHFLSYQAGDLLKYSYWLEQLAILAGYPPTQEPLGDETETSRLAGAWLADHGPFWELLVFPNRSGSIGRWSSEKIANDFEKFQDTANLHYSAEFKHRYKEMRKIFEFAKNNGKCNGAVSFCYME